MLVFLELGATSGAAPSHVWGCSKPHQVPCLAPIELKLSKANVKGPSVTQRRVELHLHELQQLPTGKNGLLD